MVGIRSVPFGMAYFQVRTVSFRESKIAEHGTWTVHPRNVNQRNMMGNSWFLSLIKKQVNISIIVNIRVDFNEYAMFVYCSVSLPPESL